MLLDVEPVDDLNGVWEQFVSDLPDPSSAVADDHGPRGFGKSSTAGLAQNPLGESGSDLIGIQGGGAFQGCGVGNRTGVADWPTFLVARFGTPDRTQFNFPSLGASVRLLTASALEFVGAHRDAGIRYIVPEGTKYRVTAKKPPDDEKKKGGRGQRTQAVVGFILRSGANDEHEMPVVPDARYVPLYEGRMVHQFDHSAKAYVSGEGRGAKWRDLEFTEKAFVPHFFVDGTEPSPAARARFLRRNRANQ